MRQRLSAAVALVCAAAATTAALGVAGCKDDPERSSAAATPAAAPPPAGTISGLVRDAHDKPVAGALVRDPVGGARARTDVRGRYTLRTRARPGTVEASAAGYLPHLRALPMRTPSVLDFALWETQPPATGIVNSADHVIVWAGCDEVASLSDRELDKWQESGVDGFVCQANQLHALGGVNAFTAKRGDPLRGRTLALQRRLRDGRVAERARRRGMSLYLGFFAASASPDATTPFVPWFDDAGWSQRVLPDIAALATVAHRLGFAGVAIDQELYGQEQGTWDWAYPGNGRGEGTTRRQTARRGAQVMRALTRGFPGVDVIAYATQLPGSWEEYVQEQINGHRGAFANRLQTNFWDGMAGVRGYAAIRLADSIFYKTPHVTGAAWDTALRENARALYARLSRDWSSWPRAAGRVHVTPFAWIDAGPSEFERARPVPDVTTQLTAFRRWGTGGAFANFAYGKLRSFDYAPYLSALRAASAPGQVDSSPPQITTAAPVTTAGRAVLTGTAADDSAVRYVRWRDSTGDEGVARLTVNPADPAAVTWAAVVPVRAGGTTVTVRVEDIKGLATQTAVTVPG